MPGIPVRVLALAAAVSLACGRDSFAESGIAKNSPSVSSSVVTISTCDDGGQALTAALRAATQGQEFDITCSSISLTTGGLDIFVPDITVVGTRPTPTLIDANGRRAFFSEAYGTLTLKNLGVRNASKLFSGGCVFTEGDVILRNSTLTNCTATTDVQYDPQQTADIRGGAISAGGTVTLYGSTISYSAATSVNGNAYGGAIDASGVILKPALDAQNHPIPGTGSSISYSVANATGTGHGLGGAIHAHGVRAYYSTISGCIGKTVGAIYVDDQTHLFNSTISGNHTMTAGGIGGISSLRAFYSYQSTVAFNVGFAVSVGLDPQGRVQKAILRDSIISNSTKYQTTNPSVDFTVDPAVTVSGSDNILQKYSIQNPQLINTIANTDPLLGPLESNGGSTKTHLLRSGSPALGRVQPAIIPGAILPGSDQRGLSRPSNKNKHSDIGSVEDTLFKDGADG